GGGERGGDRRAERGGHRRDRGGGAEVDSASAVEHAQSGRRPLPVARWPGGRPAHRPDPARGGGDRHPLGASARRRPGPDDHPGQWHRQSPHRAQYLPGALPHSAARPRDAPRGSRRIQLDDSSLFRAHRGDPRRGRCS
ncbi:MAG: hypothetical protein AVDCRST_MAG88-2240, partial [uncultured Thermomicrobiales bacterium]